ncbi:hypothetical protein Snov_4311 [Ancylobacter novellus DSM 506]|uniref:Uncharacterized protein n=2 Tax=Ancylobacter novellus TaxID=921 RepID=D7A2P6_ANCN5|nr:hypothetical protein Snov_4311 [Ancylobacter novellus DSM 506]
MAASTFFFILFIALIGTLLSGVAFLIFGRSPLRAAKWLVPLGLMVLVGAGWKHDARPVAAPPHGSDEACRKDYKSCASQEQLVDIYEGMTQAQTSCKRAARKLARFGDADIPFFAFGTYFPYEGSAKSGKISLIEEDARFQNVYGAMQRVKLKCYYDLETREVVEVTASTD